MMLSRDFSADEFACHSGERVPDNLLPNVHRLVLQVLQPLREAWANPLVVISGYRSPAWNTRIGGARDSSHMTAEAADIRPARPRDVPVLAALIEEMRIKGGLQGLGGLGKYPGWVHVDVRVPADGHLRRWFGRGMGEEPSLVASAELSEADTGPVTVG